MLLSPAQLDPAKVAGKIVVCEASVAGPPANARVDKSLAVKNAGAWAWCSTTSLMNTLNADFHSVPTVHINNVDGAAVVAYVNGAGAAAAGEDQPVDDGVQHSGAVHGTAFSSRGPLLAGGGDLLKPDVMAPGVDILAAGRASWKRRSRLQPLQRHITNRPRM
jgi:hypothetical protein